MKNTYIAAIIAVIAVVAIIVAAILLTGGSDDNKDDSDTFTVSFDTMEGSYVASQTVKKGGKATEPITTRDGYAFQGWYTSATGGTKFSFSEGITKNITLYARWTAVPENSYVVTFNANGGAPSTSQTVKSGECVAAPAAPTRSGYSFDGWYTSESGGTKFDFSSPVSRNITLYAHWTLDPNQKYTVTFNANGGAPSTSQTVKSGECVLTPTAPTKSGYRFAGWYTAASGGSAFDLTTPITSDITLYAHWDTSGYTVTFNANDGTTPTTQIVQSGKCAVRPADPVKSGSTFLGWYTAATGGNEFNFSTPITCDTTVYAHWDGKYYKVVFDANGGEPSRTQTIQSGGYATVPNDPTWAGYEFLGWYTAATGGSEFDFGTAITKDVTVYAHWVVDPTVRYTVKFDSNGGSSVPSQSVVKGGYATVPATPTKTGHTFTGWYTSAKGGSAFNFGTAITKNTTVYAHWDAMGCVVTLVDYPGYIDDMETYTVDYGDTFEHTVIHFGRDMGRSLGVSYTPDGTYHYAPYDDGKLSVEKTGMFWSEIEYGPVTGNITLYYRFA